MIRKAKESEIQRILDIFSIARDFMHTSGNPNQWNGTYPDKATLSADIKDGHLFVMTDENDTIYACFALIGGNDPTYGYIEGKWKSAAPYGTIHRVASDGTKRGVFNDCVSFARTKYNHLRVDTHEDNKPMQHVILKCGFEYAGIIYLEDGSPRLAYEWCGKNMNMRLETGRLYIRRLKATDWRKMKNIFVDFNNSEYAVYDMPLPTQDGEAEELTKSFAESGLFFAVFLKKTDEMAGYICFHKDEEKYDLGYCFHSAYHSKGYAYESVKAVLDCFVKEGGVRLFTAGTALANKPSCRLLEKLGFVCASAEKVTFDNNFYFDGGNFVLKIDMGPEL